MRSVGLHEAFPRACFSELWGEPGELGQVFVDESHFGRQVVLVQVAGEVSAGVACNRVSQVNRPVEGSSRAAKSEKSAEQGTEDKRGTYPDHPRSGRQASLPWRAQRQKMQKSTENQKKGLATGGRRTEDRTAAMMNCTRRAWVIICGEGWELVGPGAVDV